MYGGGQTAMAAVLEKFYELVLLECSTQTPKDKSGVKTVNCTDLQKLVLNKTNLKY